jgi:hypothetical protein
MCLHSLNLLIGLSERVLAFFGAHKIVLIRADYVFDFSVMNIALLNVPKCGEIYYNLGTNCTGSQRACARVRTCDRSL